MNNYFSISAQQSALDELLKGKSKKVVIHHLKMLLSSNCRKKDRGHLKRRYNKLIKAKMKEQNDIQNAIVEVGKTNETASKLLSLFKFAGGFYY